MWVLFGAFCMLSISYRLDLHNKTRIALADLSAKTKLKIGLPLV
jgi:hypothetical protein